MATEANVTVPSKYLLWIAPLSLNVSPRVSLKRPDKILLSYPLYVHVHVLYYFK